MKAKYAKPKIHSKYESVIYEITCPHCNTTIVPAPDKSVLLFECSSCSGRVYTRKEKSRPVQRTTATLRN